MTGVRGRGPRALPALSRVLKHRLGATGASLRTRPRAEPGLQAEDNARGRASSSSQLPLDEPQEPVGDHGQQGRREGPPGVSGSSTWDNPRKMEAAEPAA